MIDFTATLSRQYDRTLEAESSASDLDAAFKAKFRADMLDALMNEPQRLMRISGVVRKTAPAAEIFCDQLGAPETNRLITLLADAARGEDVALRAMEMLSSVAREYGEYHGADAAEFA